MSYVRPRLWQKRVTPPKTCYPVELNNPLPNYEGPRFGPFRHRNAPICFLDLLGRENPGEDAYVFEVIIELKRYALKVFKFYDHRSEFLKFKGTEFELPEPAFIAQFDPFYAECRAYGRMEEHGKNGVVAVHAHGFMDIPADREGLMSMWPLLCTDWNRPVEEYGWPIAERQPFRAIVKELVTNKPNFSNVGKMRDDLLALQEMGIFVQDIEKANYCYGKLVDFSLCWTTPHVLVCPRIRSQDKIDEEMYDVRYAFDRMLAAEGIFTRTKALAGKMVGGAGQSKMDEATVEKIRSFTVGRLRTNTKKPDRLGFGDCVRLGGASEQQNVSAVISHGIVGGRTGQRHRKLPI